MEFKRNSRFLVDKISSKDEVDLETSPVPENLEEEHKNSSEEHKVKEDSRVFLDSFLL